MNTEKKESKLYKFSKDTPSNDVERKEGEMRYSFLKTAEKIFSEESKFVKKPGDIKIGLEIEYSVISKDFSQATELSRDKIIKDNNDFTDYELGAAQLEWRTPPLYLNQIGLMALEKELLKKEERIKNSAQEQGVFLLRSGSNPFVPINEIKRTNKTKYQLVPNYHNSNKRYGLNTIIGKIDKVDVGNAAIIALTNSVQCNIEAISFSDTIDKTNKSFAIGPMAVALSGNARLLEEKDTGISDIRMIAWEISHDTRTALEVEQGRVTRVGLLDSYYQDLKNYFQKVSCYPFILYDPEHAFQIGMGLNWRDTRIKFIENSIVVEFRPVSTQPTVKENIAMMAFYLGRLQWSNQHKETLLDLKLVKQNREEAMHFGLNGKLWTHKDEKTVILPAKDALSIELKRATDGLESLGFFKKEIDYYFDVLQERLIKRQVPSDKLLHRFYEYRSRGYSRKKSIAFALNENESII